MNESQRPERRGHQDNLLSQEENQQQARSLKGLAPGETDDTAHEGVLPAGENSASRHPSGAGMSNFGNIDVQGDETGTGYRERGSR